MVAARTIPATAPDFQAALEAARLPTEDLAEPGRVFFVIEDGDKTVGYGGYELYGEVALLRSIVVLPEARGRGYGRAVTEQVLRHAYEAGAREAYLLTTTAEPFFEHAGFRRVERSDAPAAILATRQATSICSTAALLCRRLNTGD